MTIADKAMLVTGANRGTGQTLIEEAPSSGAKRVYAGPWPTRMGGSRS
jgi:NAD(P)-dependent dehydrogenase (short-subunit alcohol dehydrogenase family)